MPGPALTPDDLTPAQRRVVDAVDEAELVATLVELVRVPSVTGTDAESDLQHTVARWCEEAGLEVDTWALDLDALRADPDVQRVDGRYETQVTLMAADGTPGNRVAAIGIRRPRDTRSDYLKLLAGKFGDTADGDWAVIDEPTFADAILDRLVHTAYRLDLDGASMRKLEAGAETPQARP